METTTLNFSKAVVQGRAHRQANPPVPCQDAGIGCRIAEDIYALVASDGAGSAEHSDQASLFCTDYLLRLLRQDEAHIRKLMAQTHDNREQLIRWEEYSRSLFHQTRLALLEKAEKEGLEPPSLHCTLLMTLLTPGGFLTAHIGDGRGGAGIEGKTTALFTPFMTFTAGATYFLLKDDWHRFFRAYCTPVPIEKVAYFFLSTDGCQRFIMDHQAPKPSEGPFDDVLGDDAYYDGNTPYAPFFNGLVASLRECKDAAERDYRLTRLLDEGMYILDGKETLLSSLIHPLVDDDKTLLIWYR